MYYSIPTTWKTKKVQPYLNHKDETVKEIIDFFEARLENHEPKENKKDLLRPPRKRLSKRKRMARKYYKFHGKYSHMTDNYKDLKTMIGKNKKKKKFKT